MTTENEPKQKRRTRGAAKRPALIHISLRLTTEVMDYFNKYHPYTKQSKMREILTEYVRQNTIDT